jgi:transcriptional regulator with XRE-family HTH domain
MDDMGIVARIDTLCKARGWTYYRLAKASGIPYSTLNTMLHKSNVPSVPSLAKICDGFGITLSQFFSDADEIALLTPEQKRCLQLWDRLSERNRGKR